MLAARTLPRLAATSGRISSRQLSSSFVSRLLTRTASHIPTATRAFSVSARFLKAGSSDVSLSQKLAEELKYENEAKEDAEPEFLRMFNAQGIWEMRDVPGDNEVVLTRQFGDENIRIVFSIADLQNQDPSEFEQDLEEEERGEDEQPSQSEILRTVVSITKSTVPGALEIDMTCQNDQFLVENITFYKDAKLGSDNSVEADWKRRGLYIGPEFNTLDVSLQEGFEKFLDERDISEGLAYFLPHYAHHKEQREYAQWLDNVNKFVDA
ncbi:mitochondrial glycoprotein [Mycena pura]|uniref:Mitochondrial glycoprotein n=1 Tax=Mycena pura TaxID=153505 RepID=A0AAD6UPS4_9AGAR|nr:mitochondrial glycoprotein [Mycena pura]